MWAILLTTLLATAAENGDGRSFLVLPGAFYSQETSLGFAALGTATFPLRGTGSETWPSTVTAAATYTLANQSSVALWPTLYFGAHNNQHFAGEIILSHYPTRYFGIGSAADGDWQDFTRRRISTDLAVGQRIWRDLHLGATDRFAAFELVDFGPLDQADALGRGVVPGEQGGLTHGMGLFVRWDGRDNDQSARRGAYADLSVVGHPTWLGSDWGFSQLRLDTRGFVPFGNDGTLAVQGVTELGFGEVPLVQLSELGGDELLRGMYEGRFRDRCLFGAQAEVRYALVGRLRGVAFSSLGMVAPTATSWSGPPRWTAGGGIRYELDRTAHTVVRADLGAGPDGAGFILTFGEAF